ncbi:unnamed protein product, partial [Adineta ricciae]
MLPIRDGLLSSVINDQDEEKDGVVIFNQLLNTPLTNLQNNHNTTNVRTENEGAEVTLLNNLVLATLVSHVIKKNNQISHFEQQTSQVKQQMSQFEQRIA